MNKSYLVILYFVSTTCVFAQSEMDPFASKTILDLKWGNAYGEIGYLENLAGYENTHAGPVCFDVDRDGNIYILDTVNNYIKIFGQNGDLLQYFPIDNSGREHEYIVVDENNKNIWRHNPRNRTFYEYTFAGSPTKTIKYSEPRFGLIPPQFDVWDGQIILGGRLEVATISSEHGISGEPVYNATIKWFESRTEPFNMNSSEYSKRIYLSLEPELLDNGRPSSPRILIIDRMGNKQTLTFNDMSPLYHVSFLSEDKYGNIYFLFAYQALKKPKQIWKYDSSMNLIGQIDNFPSNHDFNFLMKERMVDDNGNIYFMYLSKSSGVKIIKWHTN